MDTGFLPIDQQPSVTIKDTDKLILVRYPKQVDIKEFKDVHFDLNKKVGLYKCGSSQFQFVMEKSTSADTIFRPLLARSSQKYRVAREFDDSLMIVRKLSSEWQNNSIGVEVSHAYTKVEQHDFLRVHSVPTGSLSTVDDINNRHSTKESSSKRKLLDSRENDMSRKSKKKSKKDKHS